VLSERNLLERRRAMELIGEIRQMAYALTETKIKDDEFLLIEDEPYINLVDRWEPTYEKEEMSDVLFPDGIGGQISSEADFKTLFDQFTIDKQKLVQRIDNMLQNKSQVTLKEIVDSYGLQNGLSEVVGYLSIAASDNHHFILEETIDPVWIREKR